MNISKLTIASVFLMATISSTTAQAGDAARGAKLYSKNCSSCHGSAGKGDGPAAVALFPKPRNFTDAATMSKLSDITLSETIKKGGAAMKKSPVMPAFAQLKTQDVSDLVAHLRALCQCSFKK